MPFGVRNSLDDILRRMGIGSYETADGQKISNEMLPPDVQKRVRGWGAGRDLSNAAGDIFHDQAQEQQVINRLYDPATRDAMMRATDPRGYSRRAGEVLQDYDQAQGMDQMMNEITNALAKRKIRATRSR
jgi:hypothetical protein